MNSGIYTIKTPSGNIYVGQAVNFKNRWAGHLSSLRLGKHYNKRIQHSYNKYGEENIKFSKLIICAKDNLTMYEQLAMHVLRPKLNMCPAAGSPKGIKQSAESIAKRVASNTGKNRSSATRAAISAANKGQISWNKGKTQNPEWVAKRVSSNAGRKHSPESIKKISAAKKGIKPWNKGKKASPEAKKNQSNAHLGKKISAEVRAKMSQSLKKWWAERQAKQVIQST